MSRRLKALATGVTCALGGFVCGVVWTITAGRATGMVLKETGRRLVAASRTQPEIIVLPEEVAYCLKAIGLARGEEQP